MRLRFEKVSLVGTDREISFEPGLNVIVGPTTTGKTSLMRLLRVILGAKYDGIIPELRRVPDVAAQIVVGESVVSIVRRLTQSDNAPVDVATDEFAARLPAVRADREGGLSYGDWMLQQLRLPQLRVPTAPTRPEEAATTRVSIADYLRYCRLTQQQIDTDILGSSFPFTDYKRRAVFRIFFGTFDEEVARLQEELRTVEGQLRSLRAGTSAFDRFLAGTALANRAQIEGDLVKNRAKLEAIDADRRRLAVDSSSPPIAVVYRSGLHRIDAQIADLRLATDSEGLALSQMKELGQQLRAQSARLTKAVVAGGALVDFDFRVCPRCGQTVEEQRTDPDHCYLCLQEPAQQLTREDLLVEQMRIEQQIDEADELAAAHAQGIERLTVELARLASQRELTSHALAQHTGQFVSDHADRIAQLAARQARAEAEVEQGEEYVRLLARADQARVQIEDLRARREAVESALDRAERSDQSAQARMEHLEDRFAGLVEELMLPEFETDAEPRSAIHAGSFEPIVNGRLIERHSGGMAVLINVAYILAVHQTNLELGLRIPRVLMIDGINKNLGRGGYDRARYELIWQQLARFHAEHKDDLQLIVATNDIPDFIAPLDVVRLELSETDRLVPSPRGSTLGDDFEAPH